MEEPEISLFNETIMVIDEEDDTICSICWAEFLDREDLKTHVTQVHLTETRKTRFCKVCNKIFPDTERCMTHILFTHLAKLKCCKHCFRLFPDIVSKMRHEKKHKFRCKREIYCSQCSECFNDQIFLERHEYNVHSKCDEGIMLNHGFAYLSAMLNMNIRRFLTGYNEEITYVCACCQFTTPSMLAYIDHLRETPCTSYACDMCVNVYYKRSNLIRHFLSKHGKHNIVECPKCHIMYTRTALKVHEKTCSLLKCLECNLTFRSVDEITQHKIEKHKGCALVNRCRFCNKQVVGEAMMRKHVERSHKSSLHLYKYKCVYCDIIFKHPRQLFGHFFSTHKDIEPYTCRMCNLKFRLRKKFSIHVREVHKNVGHLEFDERYHVAFVAKKSESAFVPQSFYPEGTEEHPDNKNNEKFDTSVRESSVNTKQSDRSPEDESDKITNLGCETNNRKNSEMNTLENLDQATDKNLDQATENTNESEKNNKEESNEMTKDGSDKNDNQQSEVSKDIEKDNTIEVISIDSDDTDTGREHKTDAKRNVGAIERQHKLRSRKRKQDQSYSSDDSDVPLKHIRKSRQSQRAPWNKTISKKIVHTTNSFICRKCCKNCYTHQNYKHHMSLHAKYEYKKCIKCDAQFTSGKDLQNHIDRTHSKSDLTDTLKKVMLRRKQTQLVPDTRNHLNTKRFKVAMTKVNLENHDTQAVLKRVQHPKNGSVKNFIENFVPDCGDTLKIMRCVTMGITPEVRPPRIAVHKCDLTPASVATGLKMPVRFKDTKETHSVTVKYVTGGVRRANLNYGEKISNYVTNRSHNVEDHSYCDGVGEQVYEVNNYVQNEDDDRQQIPEVAEEVMLDTEEFKQQQTIVVPNVPKAYKSIRIGTLQPQAPYYKILKLDEILAQPEQKQEEKEEIKYVSLPDGTQLVSVNPLAHLIDKDVLKKKMPKKYYQPKKKDIGEAINKFLNVKPKKKAVKKIKELSFVDASVDSVE